MAADDGLTPWERRWAPYDESTYREVLAGIRPDDVVVEIGAGDLRLARRLAVRARRVYAIEHNAGLVTTQPGRPSNLDVICDDARTIPFPEDVTIGVLLMRHCTHVRLYAEKLVQRGARRLVTNARWGFGVETIELQASRIDYGQVPLGWYACWCGATGFVEGPTEQLVPRIDAIVHEVVDCPACKMS